MKGLCTSIILFVAAAAFADQAIYSDQLDNSWQNWSWANTNFSNTSPVQNGSRSIAVTPTGGNQAIYLHHNAQSVSGFRSLTFYLHGGPIGGQQLQVQGTLWGGPIAPYILPPLAANTWTKVVVPLKGIGVRGANNFDGFWIQDRSNTAHPTYYVDSISLVSEPAPATTLEAYGDTLVNGWQNWSWASVDVNNTSPVLSGGRSVRVTENAAFDGFYLHHDAIDASRYKTVSFYLHGGATGGQQLQVRATNSGLSNLSYNIPTLAANTWTRVMVPLSLLGIWGRGDFDGFYIQGRVNAPQATYYVDDISVSVDPMTNPGANITVESGVKYAISPLIYGANSTDYAGMGTGFRFARSGGNRLTAYNWENNASNAGSDWFFQNDSLMGVTDEAGWAHRVFIQEAQAGGAVPLVTIQIAGYVSADKWGDGDVRNYPDYLNTRFKVSVPAKPGGNFAYPPNVNDGFVYQDECVNYLKQFAQPSLPIMFSLDNEPDLWSHTHNEIHPQPATYAEMITRSTEYAAAIKNVYSNATIFGPVNYGWYGFMALQGAPDQNGRNFLDFYLAGMKTAEAQAGKRLLDVLDIHWYPEAYGDDIRITSDGETQGLGDARIQSTRSLWDPTYVENSWIAQSLGNAPISLIPMVKGKIRTHYPNTKLSITEYNYGGSNAISGAIAQADFLGILGRNGVYAAANWGLGSGARAQLAGFKSFINYDRNGARFGDQGLFVTGETPSENSVYASLDSSDPSRMVLVLINKSVGQTPMTISTPGFKTKTAVGYVIEDQLFETPGTVPVSGVGEKVKVMLPPLSITTVELKRKVLVF